MSTSVVKLMTRCPHCKYNRSSNLQDYPTFRLELCDKCNKTFVISKTILSAENIPAPAPVQVVEVSIKIEPDLRVGADPSLVSLN